MTQPTNSNNTNAITWLGAGGFECFVSRSASAHQWAGVYALDGFRDWIGKTGVDDTIVAESTLIGIGESEPTSFGAVLAIARSARFAMAT